MSAPTKPSAPEPWAECLADVYQHLLIKRQERLQAQQAGQVEPEPPRQEDAHEPQPA